MDAFTRTIEGEENMKSAVRIEYEKQKDLFVPYLNWKYPSCWWGNIRWFFRSFKLAFERARKGYSSYDIVDLDSYFVGKLACALEDFAEKNTGMPQEYVDAANGDDDKAFENWNNDIRRASQLLFKSLESLEEFNYNIPEFPMTHSEKQDNKIIFGEATEEGQAWVKMVEEVAIDRKKCRKEAFEWLNEHWENLWI